MSARLVGRRLGLEVNNDLLEKTEQNDTPGRGLVDGRISKGVGGRGATDDVRAGGRDCFERPIQEPSRNEMR